MLDENISWEEYIRTVKTNLAKMQDHANYTTQSLYLKKNHLKEFILHIFIHTSISLTLHGPVATELN